MVPCGISLLLTKEIAYRIVTGNSGLEELEEPVDIVSEILKIYP